MGASPKGRETLLTGATVCYNLYAAADGKLLALAALEPKFFTSFCRAVGRSDWIESQFSPAKDGEPVYEEIKALFLKRPRDEWVELLKAADCCLEPVLDVAELQGHPMSGERGRFARDEGGTNRFMLPAAFGVRQGPLPRAPGLGEHTRKVLEEAGLDPGTLLKVMEAAERRDLS
jgi:crotonobetainyl-CoA:carnitine CoA-transferase CaiB-like acyl-CoA transferase